MKIKTKDIIEKYRNYLPRGFITFLKKKDSVSFSFLVKQTEKYLTSKEKQFFFKKLENDYGIRIKDENINNISLFIKDRNKKKEQYEEEAILNKVKIMRTEEENRKEEIEEIKQTEKREDIILEKESRGEKIEKNGKDIESDISRV